MTNQPQAQTLPAARRPFAALVATGVLLVLLGLGLPQALSVSAPTGSAAVGGIGNASSAAPAPELSASLSKLAVGAVVVGGLWLGIGRLFRRPAAAATVGYEVRATLPIGTRGALHLVKAGEHKLLIGVDASGVKALLELPGSLSGGTPVNDPENIGSGLVVGPFRAAVPIVSA